MDLIYTNAAKEDVGVLFDYEFDLAFGVDENNFECKVQDDNHCMEPGSFLYIEGTEYGGIVDSIAVDTDSHTITYSGRTWHGILAGNVIEPESGYDYFIVNGDANKVIADLIQRLDIGSVFTASEEDSGINITSYAFSRYVDGYSGIRKMLADVCGKLKMEYKTDTVVLSAVYLTDHSHNEEWDDSQAAFSIKKNFRPVNHLICLGTGNLKDRHVIHLFTDENGGIQPYKTTETPLSDADYILDTTHQVLFGLEEVTDVYDYSSAQTTEHFIKLTEQPSDWASNYAAYFIQDESENYVSVEGVEEAHATALTAQPSDWADNYGKYSMMVDGKYKTVEAVTTNEYKLQSAKPSDWETNYKNYFTYFTDGVEDIWTAARPDKATRYNLQTKKPSDWEANYKNYFMLGSGFVPVQPWADWDAMAKKYIYYTPEWEPKKYYTAEQYDVAPQWESDKYYKMTPRTGAPDFVSGMYYTVQIVIVNPPFAKNKFFEKRLDHFADLVAGGIERLKDSFNCDSVSIDLDLVGEYDIGDIVGATEHKTGLAVWQPITKKIVSIKNNTETISYEIGVK